MGNDITEKQGLAAVVAFEAAQGRTDWTRTRGCGYDLITRNADGSDERHIEVKATSKGRFAFRWLEALEQKALLDDDKFYFYLVTNADTEAPDVFVYDREKLRQRFSKEVTTYLYVFPAEDFR